VLSEFRDCGVAQTIRKCCVHAIAEVAAGLFLLCWDISWERSFSFDTDDERRIIVGSGDISWERRAAFSGSDAFMPM